MRNILFLFLICISNTTFCQFDCSHYDSYPSSPPKEIISKIYLDTSLNFSLDYNSGKELVDSRKDSSWIWRKYFVVNFYNVEDTLYFKDTLQIAEGFIYKNKRNDAWTIKSYLGRNVNYPSHHVISENKLFYLKDIPIISLCSLDRSQVFADFDTPKAEIVYPWEIEDNEGKKSTIIDLNIECVVDSNGLLKCSGIVRDSIQIFNVEAKYLQAELNQLSIYKYLIND